MWQAVNKAISQRKTEGYFTFFDQQNQERKRYNAAVQVPGTPFIVAAIVNIDEFFLPTQKRKKQAGQEVLAQARQTIIAQTAAVERQFKVVGLLCLAGLSILGVLSGLFLAGRISRPLKELAAYAKKLPFQDFSSPPDPQSHIPRRYLKYKNEVGNLAESLDFMEANLRENIKELVSGNTSSMFVTVFLGILDTVTGRVLSANGGHNPPLVIRTRGSVDFLAPSGDALVGAFAAGAPQADDIAMLMLRFAGSLSNRT